MKNIGNGFSKSKNRLFKKKKPINIFGDTE